MEFIKGAVLIVGSTLSFAFLFTGIKILLAGKSDYIENRLLTGSPRNPIKGSIKTFRDGVRDYRVKSGLAVNTKKNIWVEQGALSEESIDNIIG